MSFFFLFLKVFMLGYSIIRSYCKVGVLNGLNEILDFRFNIGEGNEWMLKYELFVVLV